MTRPCVGPRAPTAPSVRPPRGACDSHAHVLGPFARYPLADIRPYTPPPATVDALTAMLDATGLDRVVVAHVSAHGFDLSATLDAIAALGARARGVAMLAADVSDARLSELHEAGIRGVRLSHAYGHGQGLDAASLVAWADRIGPLGWHLATWPTSIDDTAALLAVADRLAAPVVVDHLGNHAWSPDGGVDQRGVRMLVDALSTGHVWMKLSAPYRADPRGAPWPSLAPFVQAFVDAAPDRLLWASDWPHVGLWDDAAMPASGSLLDWLYGVVDDDAMRRRILVDNPAALYGFPAS